MKHVYAFLFAAGFLLTNSTLKAQSQLVNENFSTGLPASWTQNPAATWSLSPNLGSSSTACIFTQDLSLTSPTLNISTNTLNLNAVTNLTVNFKLAIVGNNFMPPDLALYYDAGNGPNFIARWGTGFSANTTYSIAYTDYDFDYVAPLDAEHVMLLNYTHILPAINGNAVKFIFSAEPYNGGYVVLDDILISGKPVSTVGIKENSEHVFVTIFPNPSQKKTFTLEGKGIRNIQLSDNSGKSLPVQAIRTSDDHIELDLEGFSKGIYYLHLITEKEEVLVKKLVLE